MGAAAWPSPASGTCAKSCCEEHEGISMRNAIVGLAVLTAVSTISPASAQQTIKIGLILPYSGQFADPGTQADNGIKLYMQQHGDTVAGKKIEVIRKDTGGIAPDVAKRLAQELIVREIG